MDLFDDLFTGGGGIQQQTDEWKHDHERCSNCNHMKKYHNSACTYCGDCMSFVPSGDYMP